MKLALINKMQCITVNYICICTLLPFASIEKKTWEFYCHNLNKIQMQQNIPVTFKVCK